jgi:hypothetical protein
VDADELRDLLKPGHQETLVHRLAPLTEAQRKTLAPTVRSANAWGSRKQYDDSSLAIASLATLGGPKQVVNAASWWMLERASIPRAVRALRDRAPHWLTPLAEVLLTQNDGWSLVRALVRGGLVERPESEAYARTMAFGLVGARGPILDALRADPGLLEHEVWTMLGSEGSGRSLSTIDGYTDRPYALPGRDRPEPRPEHTWRHAMVTLAAEGAIDRCRLLDDALAAPLRDWKPVDVTWFVGLHDALEPDLDEVADRQGTYARLLTVDHGPAVKAAQKQLTRLLNDPRLQVEPLLAASRATLGRTDKGSVSAQLRLLGALARAHPTAPVAELVRVAVDHPRTDLREQAEKLLGTLGESLAPAAVAKPAFVPPEPQPRPQPGRVVPVVDADELGDLFLRLVEEADDPIELERMVDGLLRLADHRPTHAAVLERRVQEAQLYRGDLRLGVATLARAWLAPRKRFGSESASITLAHAHFGSRPAPPVTLLGVAGRRLSDVGRAVRHGAVHGLALPSYDDGTIDPAHLSVRLADLGRRHHTPVAEAALAVLRVDPARLDEVVIPRSAGACGRAVADAVRRIGARSPAWVREVRQLPLRNRWEKVGPRLSTFADPASGQDGDSPVDALLARAQPWPCVPDELEFGEYEPRFDQTLAFCALLLPHHPDLLAAHLHPLLHRDLGKDRGVCGGLHDALARSRVPTSGPTASALVLGLAAKDARTRTAAQDAVIDLCRFGLLDGAEAGVQAAQHLVDNAVVGQRVAGGLAEIARATDQAVVPVLDALRAVLPVLPGRRDASSFLELTADLCQRTGGRVELPEEFRDQAASKASSATARAARRLV